VVFTNGCFDVLHPGHVEHLTQAKALGDVLVVGLNSDASVQRLKGAGRPLVAEADRAAMLAALRSVDAVTLFDEDTPLELISTLLPDVLVKGGDYDLDGIVGREVVEKAGGEVRVLPFVEGYSTTGLLDRLKEAE
jgi:D-beta-D-heptose 7-phosphate kinase/D-beta-D-heptose 1-phosphate adenosyltransferase